MSQVRLSHLIVGVIIGTASLVGPATVARAATTEPTIETVAGLPSSGRPATTISVHPSGLAYDTEGNLFVGDTASSTVWRIAPDGTAWHHAGLGTPCPTTPEDCLANNGDGGPATEARLFSPAGVGVLPDGDVLVAERGAHRVRRIDSGTGRISTFAGSGETDYLPEEEGALATEARLFMPAGLFVDRQGNAYIVDMGNARIRRVDPSGHVWTVAGCGPQRINTCDNNPDDGRQVASTYLSFATLSTAAVDDAGRLYVAAVGGISRVEGEVYRRIAGRPFRFSSIPGEGEGGPAVEASFREIGSMAFGANGDLLITDSYWNRVARVRAPVEPTSRLDHVAGCSCGQGDIAGNGFAGDGGPAKEAVTGFAFRSAPNIQGGIVGAADGDVLFSDIHNNRVRRVDSATGKIETVVGNGYGNLFDPGLGVHDFGADSYRETQVRNPQSGFSGDGREAVKAQLASPYDVEVDHAGNVYVLETDANRVRRIGRDGRIATVVGSGCLSDNCTNRGSDPQDGPAVSAKIWGATAIALDRTGTQLYIIDAGHSRVRQANLGLSPYTVYPVSASPVRIPPGHLATIFGDGISEIPCCGYEGQKSCFLVSPYCGEGLPWSLQSSGMLTGVAADDSGNLYVADAAVNTVRRVDAITGEVTTFLGKTHASNCDQPAPESVPAAAARLCGPTDVTFGPDGDLFVSESGWEGFAESLSYGIVDEAAPQGSRVVRVDMSAPPYLTTVVAGASGVAGLSGDGGAATQAKVAYPHGVAFDGAGNIYIADTGNARIRRVAPDGTISTIAGSGSYRTDFAIDGCGASGDGGPARDAELCAPMGIVGTGGGTLLIADTLNNRVRSLDLAPGD